MMLSSANEGTFDKADLQRLEEAWSQPGALKAMIGWYRALMQGVRAGVDFDIRIKPPTLILWGEKDIALDFAGAKDSLDWTDNGRLVSYPQASHWVQEDKPEAVNGELLGFLGS